MKTHRSYKEIGAADVNDGINPSISETISKLDEMAPMLSMRPSQNPRKTNHWRVL